MNEATEHQIEEFVAACHRVGSYGLVRCSSGNLSMRIDADQMLITASRSWMAHLTREEIAICRISNGEPVSGGAPSVETGFHAGILRERADANTVLHFQSPSATTLACCDPEQVDFNVIPEIAYYIGPIATVPFILPGSADLAEAVVQAMKGHDLAVMRNHGLVTAGVSLADVIQKAAFFELACEVILRGSDGVRPLPDEAIADLRAAARGCGPGSV